MTSEQLDPADPPAGRVLLVDDNAVNRLITRGLLRRLGIAPDEAGDGCQALSAMRVTAYALVLMDCQMPVVDGYEATRRLRSGVDRGATAGDVPVVAITAHDGAGSRERCLDAGMDDYLARPFGLADLAAVVHRWLG
jgi:CheY-like chemotaxis protein